MLHGAGRRRAAGRVRDPRPAGRRPAHHDRRRPRPTEDRTAWADAFCATGASQCGFCTPGIIVRLAGLRAKGGDADEAAVGRALAAHLCRCTGWRTILRGLARRSGWAAVAPRATSRRRAGGPRSRAAARSGSDPEVALGEGGFADDTAPADALVAVPDGARRLVGRRDARRGASRGRQGAGPAHDGRRSSRRSTLPDGRLGGALRDVLGGARLPRDRRVVVRARRRAGVAARQRRRVRGKVASPVAAAARALADQHGRAGAGAAVPRGHRAAWARSGRRSRPGSARDGTGVRPGGRAPPAWPRSQRRAPGVVLEEVDVPGPPTSVDLRAAGWAELAVLRAGLAGVGRAGHLARRRGGAGVGGATVASRCGSGCGDPLDEVVLRSYCIGAAHMALGWVTSEGLAVDADGTVHDLTVRSFGIVRAADTPVIEVEIEPDDGSAGQRVGRRLRGGGRGALGRRGCPPDLPDTVRAPPRRLT